MVNTAPKKRANKPPIRRVPPGANRTARNYTLGAAVSKEEKAAVTEIAKTLGFRTASALLGWVLENLFEVSRNPLHLAAWEADTVKRMADAQKLAQRAPYEGVLNGSFLQELSGLVDAALKKSFGEPEKRESAVSADTSRLGGDHDP